MNKDLVTKLEEIKSKISHTHLNPSVADLIDFLANSFLKEKNRVSESINRPCEEFGVHQGPDKKPLVRNESVSRRSSKRGALYKDSKNQSTSAAESARRRSGYILAQVRREIFERDKCCQWPIENNVRKSDENFSDGLESKEQNKTFKICGSRYQLQIDHKRSRWLGGSDEKGNLQVLCGIHNRLKFEKETIFRNKFP